MMIEGGWRFWFQYLCCPLFGSLLAFVFYTKCFVKAEEYLADSEEGSELAQERLGAALDSLSSPVQAKRRKSLGTEDDEEIDAKSGSKSD